VNLVSAAGGGRAVDAEAQVERGLMRQRCVPVDAAAGVPIAAGEMLPGAPARRLASAIRALLRFSCRGGQGAAAHRHDRVLAFRLPRRRARRPLTTFVWCSSQWCPPMP
jgi:hypothetical protein